MDNRNFLTPECVTEAIHAVIAKYPGKYAAMAKQLDPETGTDNALRNRVRQINGQMVPVGMILEIEAIAGSNLITESFCKHAGGVFVKLPEIDKIDNEELLHKFNALISELGEFSRKHSQYISDGRLTRKESKSLRASGYNIQSRVAEIWVITEMLFGEKK